MTRGLFIAFASAVWLSGPVLAQSPMTVTTDTAEYCFSLADRLAGQGEMPPHARTLWHAGRTMCEEGHIRSGLLRLREAMVLLHGPAE